MSTPRPRFDLGFTAALLCLGWLLPAQGGRQDKDADRDGLSDFQEIHKYLTNPKKADSDGDGIPDGETTLGVGIDAGNFWFREGDCAEVVVPFGGADKRDPVSGVAYRFVTRNQSEGAKCQVDSKLRVVRK